MTVRSLVRSAKEVSELLRGNEAFSVPITGIDPELNSNPPCKKFAVGDLLWVKESFAIRIMDKGRYKLEYRAGGSPRILTAAPSVILPKKQKTELGEWAWASPVSMPSWASRFVLEVLKITPISTRVGGFRYNVIAKIRRENIDDVTGGATAVSYEKRRARGNTRKKLDAPKDGV